jgi:hypothetical protein
MRVEALGQFRQSIEAVLPDISECAPPAPDHEVVGDINAGRGADRRQ